MSCSGAKPKSGVMAKLWTSINPAEMTPQGAKPKHITLAFYYMKQYLTKEVDAMNVGGHDEKTV